jgi:prophage regulatory protein
MSEREMHEKAQRLLRLVEVRSRIPYSRSTIYQLIAQKKFPKPINLGGRAVAWLESDIDGWIAARVESARGNCDRSSDAIIRASEATA